MSVVSTTSVLMNARFFVGRKVYLNDLVLIKKKKESRAELSDALI